MGQTNKTIEVNGRRYDAITGAIISDMRPGPKPASSVHSRHPHDGRSLDGFARVSRDKDVQPVTHRSALPKPTLSKPVAKPLEFKTNAKPHTPAQHFAAHKQQRAVTLMRTAVKKPQIKPASVIKSKSRTDLLVQKPSVAVAPKLSYGSVDKTRHLRAERMVKSPAVMHFNAPAPITRLAKSQPAPQHHHVAVVPAAAPATPAAQPFYHSVGNALDFVATAPKHHTAQPASRPSDDIFAQALATATSHEQVFDEKMPRSRSKASRIISISVAGLVALLVVGFFGYKNAPQISLQVASYRSGVHAKLPAYQPTNFAFDKLEYGPGDVVASYVSSTGNEKYSISQKSSNLDSQALLSNVVSTAQKNYKTYERAGLTVYVLSNNTATWVDSGILYTVNGNSSLTSSQLLDLASSM